MDVTYHEKKQIKMSDRDVAAIVVGFIRKDRGWDYSTRVVNGVIIDNKYFDSREPVYNVPEKNASVKEVVLLDYIDELKRRYGVDF